MTLKNRLVLIQFLMTVLFLWTVSYLAADTISWPVSVAVPTGIAGDLNSKPVSIAVPVGMEGQIIANPVSVAVPTGFEGGVMTRPVSVALPVSAADGTYMGRPATVAFQPEKSGDPDLIGLWHMDGDWTDSSGNSLHGIPYNGVTFSNDKKLGAQAGSFDGIDDYVEVASSSLLRPTQLTISAWVKPQASGIYKTILTNEPTSSSNQFGYGFRQRPDNSFWFVIGKEGQSAASPAISKTILTPGTWYHLAGTYDGSQINFYVNGVLESTVKLSTTITSTFPLRIGRLNSNNEPFAGLIDELAIYKRALTAEEVAVHYAAGVNDPAAPAPPVLDPLPAFVGSSTINLSGTRTSNTSVWVNNKKISAFENLSTWQGTYGTLQPGTNILNVTTVDTAYRQSQQVTRTVYYDNVPPVIASSTPVNGSNTAKVVSSVTINLYDANAGVDLAGSTQGATVKNAAGQTIAGTWTTSATKSIVFTPTNPFPADTYTVAVYPVDMVGNRTAQPQQIVFTNHDTSAPITKAILSGTKDSAGWFSTSVTVTLTATDGDSGSGVAKTEYSLDNVTWQLYSAPFVFEKDGDSYVYFRSTDVAGNIENPAKSQEIRINKTGLVGYWKMDGDWRDSSVVGNDGTSYNGATFSPNAKVGTNSGQFNGSNSYAAVPDSPTLHSNRNISVSGWMYVNGFNKTWQSIFWKGNSPETSTGDNREYTLFLNSAGYLHLASTSIDKVGIGQWANDTQAKGGYIQAGSWHHFAAVISSDQNYMKVYIDGVEKASSAYSSSDIRDTGNALMFGGNPSWDSYFNGLLDDIRIYNRALTATEIMEQYRNYSIGVPTVEAVASPTNVETITLRGTKPADTVIVVSGATIVPRDAATTWTGSYTLKPGMNNISVTAMDVDGFHSQPVILSVALDQAAPAVSATDPVNGGIFRNNVNSISFTLNDAFTSIDFAATTLNGAVSDFGGRGVAGAWSTSGTGTSGTVTFTPAIPMSEGVYTATIQPTDTFGNRSTYTIAFTVDATPPTVPTIYSQSAPTRFTSATVTGTKATDASQVVVGCAGATVGAVSYPTAISWSVNLSNLKEGANTVMAYALDAAGNQSGAASMTFTVDTTPPAKPAINSPASPTRNNSVTLTGTKEANSYLYVNSQLTAATFSDTSWSYTASLSEGSNGFTAFAKDAAGNQSSSASVSVVRDTTAPTIFSSTPGSNALTSSADSITVTLNDTYAGVDLAASLAGALVKNAAGSAIAGSWSVAGNAIVFTPTIPLPEGAYTVTLSPVDTLGNKGFASFSFTLDRTPPTTQALVLSPASPVKAGTVTFTLTFSEAMTTAVQPTVTFTRGGLLSSTYALAGSWLDNKTWRGSYPFTGGTGDGTYTVTVSGSKDLAGNEMASQAAGTFVLDTTPPAAPNMNQPVTPTRIATQTLTGAKEANTAIVINGIVRVPLNGATTWSHNYPLAEGVNTLTISARDAAGNDSLPITPAPAITLDTTPPAFTIDSYKNPSPTVSQVISGTKEPGCIVKLNGATIIDATDQNAAWSYTLNLTDGITNHLVFTVADALGNTTTRTLDILCDTAPPPALAAGMLVADGSGKGTEATLTWPSYIEPADLGYYRVYYAAADFASVAGLTPVGTVTKGTRTFKVTGLTQGSRYFFAVVPVSASGNSDPTIHTASAVPTDTLPPEDVTGLSAWAGHSAADGNTVTLSWAASVNSMGDLADQVLYTDAGQGYDAGTSLGKTATTFTKKGLNDATSYKFKITAKDTLGHESTGSVVTAVTRLANPGGLTATPGSQKVTLAWNQVASPYVKLYNVYRLQSASQQTDVAAMTLIKSQTGTSFTDTGLVNGTTYQYAVTTLNTSGAERTGVQSVTGTPRGDTTGPVISGVNLAANQVLTAPVTITASATDAESAMGRIELWIDGVLAATQNGGTLSYAWNVVNTIDGNHTVRIAAYDAAGNLTEQSIPVVVSLAPPAMPVITSTFSGPVNQKSVTITGTAQTGATVSLRVNSTVVAQQVALASTFTFTGVVLNEGDNLVAAKAGNRGGDSPFTPDLKVTVVTTAPSAPVSLTVKALAGGSVQFTWQAGPTGAPVGYNLYEVPASFAAITDPGVKKTNSSLIPYLLKEYIPADDTQRSYVVTAVDGAGNESPASGVVTVAADRAAPAVTAAVFSDATGATPVGNTYGHGTVQAAVTVSESLSEAPFFSLEPQNASPIVVALRKVDDTHYAGSITIDATSPHGPTTWKFSGKDLVGNRGNASGAGPTIDVKGPTATITAPLTLLKTTAGTAAVNLAFDEPSTATPSLVLKAADNGTATVTGLASTDGGIHWSGTVDPSALAEGTAQFLLAGAKDRFGNIGTAIKAGGIILLYRNVPPAPAVPAGLASKPGKGGSIALTWTKVADAQGYNVYRQGPGDSAPVLVTSVGTAVTCTDTPTSDGSYAYSVSSLGLLNVESAQSGQVTAVSDRTAPQSPTGLALTMTGNGVQATWDAVTAPAEAPASYRLYRAADSFADLTGLAPVATAATNSATDPAPDSSRRFYAVTALDSLGNESSPTPAQKITFPVAPVANLFLIIVDDGKPSLSWSSGEANVQGFYIYRNGARINQTPTTSTSYSDGYYAGGVITYGVSAVSSLGTESPVKEVSLPRLSVGLKDGAAMHRGLLETVALMASVPADAANSLTIDTVSIQIGTLPASNQNGPFTVNPGMPLEIGKVAATEATAPPQEAVVVTAIMYPAPGTTVKLTRSSLAAVLSSGTALEIFNDPLVRGTQASVRLKVNNLGSARSEFVTSENGGATSHVTVYLKDQDGNVLAQGNLSQRTGAVVNSGSYATARLQPGENFLSDPITFAVPASAPYKVFLEAVIDNSWYHYGQDDQVIAPGFRQVLDATIADVSYTAIARTDKAVYKQGESVVISGSAVSTVTGVPAAFVPVKIGISVNGFDRFFTVNTDGNGIFSYTYTPASNETGSYSAWASHPDLTGRSIQAGFSIIGLSVYPTLANVTILKGKYLDIPVTLTNLGGQLSGLIITRSSSNGVTAEVLNAGSGTLAAGERRIVTLRLTADAGAPAFGFASLVITTAEGISERMEVNVAAASAIPLIATSPSYIDTGIVRGSQRIETFSIANTGLGSLGNARIDGPALPWLSLTNDRNLGNIPPGQRNSIGILIHPDETVPQGVYNDRLVIYSENHIPYTFNVQVTVTSSAVGGVQFSLLDELMKQVGGATITLQHQTLPELYYTLTSAADGTVSLFDIPEGRYSYNVSAAGHKPYGGSFVITPGITTSVPVGLEVTLVQIEWSVTPVVLEDRYRITVSQTFATNVPTAVIVTEPPNVNLPELQPGQVFNGEFSITNYGLTAADFQGLSFPPSVGDYDVEVLANIPPRLGAKQKVTVTYRITRRQQTAASIAGELASYGGGSCSGSIPFTSSWSYVICPNALNERTVTITSTSSAGWNNCLPSKSVLGYTPYGIGPSLPDGTPGFAAMSSGGNIPPKYVPSTSLPDNDEGCIYPRRPNKCPDCTSGAP